ncbi:YagK/YfjJ domain-containing protein [Undibacterium flavidum]|uniref:Inovirus-type Gp2 protein n=1 Tax=Undibacterium flavidum TaxID=2762297 RepID=A0ABR6YE90_9BURK|nr:inovirus-type Gp2 protein [Undibacterium flavidum]MBC3874881.1 inovirus-type Gp2 protein [Undibacterium flavidum]
MNTNQTNQLTSPMLNQSSIYAGQANPIWSSHIAQHASLSPADAIKSLECFVSEIVSGKLHERSIPELHCESLYNQRPISFHDHYCLMGAYLNAIGLLPVQYQYTNSINLFIECCAQIGWMSGISSVNANQYGNPSLYRVSITEINWKDYLRFVDLLVETGSSERYRYLRAQTKRAIGERFKTCCDYVDALFGNNDRLIVLRVDLAYTKAYSSFSSLTGVLNDLDHLTMNMTNNAIFDDMAGYIFKVEYGVEKGMHIHAIFFFNGSERRGASHIFHTQQIGEYWKNVITMGKGVYWNCNDQIKNFQRLGNCGLGLIHWSDKGLRENLLSIVVHYICKERQSVKSPVDPYRKMIRKMLFPKKRDVKLGRPRKISS